uniref:Kazrin, periplakin interacting protein n=1 Tax=Naja naja TaxID=35670 RepID=A0A8C6Y2H3_NAJNA
MFPFSVRKTEKWLCQPLSREKGVAGGVLAFGNDQLAKNILPVGTPPSARNSTLPFYWISEGKLHCTRSEVLPPFRPQLQRGSLLPVERVLLREEVSQLQEEIHLLRQMKDMLTKELEETHGGKASEILPATELKVQLAQKEQELARAKEALQAMKADRKRLKGEKSDLVSQMQQLYSTLESREEQLRDFIRNYEQHRKESEDAVKALAKEKDLLEREKWELRRQAKEATDHASALRSQLDLKDNRMKELEAELAMAKQSLATLTKDVPKRHSLAMPGETLLNGNQEWVMQADLPLTAAIRQSQQTLYHAHPQHTVDRQGVRVSPCHSRQPSIISDASAAEGDRSSTPSDINFASAPNSFPLQWG